MAHIVIYQHGLDSPRPEAKLFHTLEPATRFALDMAKRGRLIRFSIDHPAEDTLSFDELKDKHDERLLR
jgi:hypothetical protein